MNSKYFRLLASSMIGIVISITGIIFIGVYVVEAYLSKVGKPDQSLLFWYLPILFFGLLALAGGLCIGIPGFTGLSKIKMNRLLQFIRAAVKINPENC